MKVPQPTLPVEPTPCMDPHADPFKTPRMSLPVSFLRLRAFLTVMVLLFVNFSTSVLADAATDCVCNYNPNVDYFPVKLAAEYATGFSIEYFKSYKKLTVQSASTGPIVTYAYLCGTPLPAGASSANLTIQIPIDSTAIFSTTFLPLVNYINKRDTLRFINSDETSLPSCERARVRDGLLSADYDITSTVSEVKANSLAATGAFPDVVFTDVFSFSSDTNTVNTEFGGYTKTFPIFQSSEKHVLGPIDWLKPVAALYNVEAQARYVVSSIKARYDCVKNLVLADPPLVKKKVMWGSYYSGYGGLFFMSTCPNYYCQLIADAGGELIIPASSSAADVAAAAAQADVWIYVDGNFLEPSAFNGPFMVGANLALFNTTNVVVNQGVYDILGSFLSDWFDTRLAQHDVLLMDLVQVFYGDRYISDVRDKVFLRNVYTEPAASQDARDPDQCDVNTSPYVSWLYGPCYQSDIGDLSPITPVLCSTTASPVTHSPTTPTTSTPTAPTTFRPTSSPTTPTTFRPTTWRPSKTPTRSNPTRSPTHIPTKSPTIPVIDTKNNRANVLQTSWVVMATLIALIASLA